MPDISMCMNKTCPLKETCYRFKAEPKPRRQSYSGFKPVNGNCENYIKLNGVGHE